MISDFGMTNQVCSFRLAAANFDVVKGRPRLQPTLAYNPMQINLTGIRKWFSYAVLNEIELLFAFIFYFP
jgi:hypothetical protein